MCEHDCGYCLSHEATNAGRIVHFPLTMPELTVANAAKQRGRAAGKAAPDMT